jgi:hypothetical protein
VVLAIGSVVVLGSPPLAKRSALYSTPSTVTAAPPTLTAYTNAALPGMPPELDELLEEELLLDELLDDELLFEEEELLDELLEEELLDSSGLGWG